MIGVVPKHGQLPLVEEFFELFKTPWELWRPGRHYDVVVATATAIREVTARLLVIYGPEVKSSDRGMGIQPRSAGTAVTVEYGGRSLPIHGNVATFDETRPSSSFLRAGSECAGLRLESFDRTVLRFGYDLFEELELLLSIGQPAENAHIPALDIHIEMLRASIVDAGLPLLEVPPVPAGCRFLACLTHDIDFVGIRRHKFDHTMWGFLYRSTVGAVRNFWHGRLSVRQLIETWRAVAALPFVFLGWARDFWEPFTWYLKVERNLPATYFLIPFKGRAGDYVAGRYRARRATAYDVEDIRDSVRTLVDEGCEIGVHGIDAWHSAEHGKEELERITGVTHRTGAGVRMHWLLGNEDTFRKLEEAGFAYDSTVGYNETVGYRAGTSQVFRPLTARALLELPLHIQDGALFYSQRLDLSESEAWLRCRTILDQAERAGGVVTVLWHDRSHAPERFWGNFYVRLIDELHARGAGFVSGRQAVSWFRWRRSVRFEEHESEDGMVRATVSTDGDPVDFPLTVRVYHPASGGWTDRSWNGLAPLAIELSASTCALS